MTDNTGENYKSFKNWKPESFGSINKEDSVYFDNEFRLITREKLDNKRILEIGFGNGSFASWAIKKGCIYFGFEKIPDLVEVAKDCGFKAHDVTVPFDKVIPLNSLDYIVAFDVFEHLDKEEFHQMLGEFTKVLKSGGKVIGRVPSGDSPFSVSLQNGDYTHKTYFGSSMISQFAISNNFTVDSIRSPAFPIYGMGLVSVTKRLFVSAARKFFYPLIIKIFMGGNKIVLTPNMIFVLRKP